MRQGQKYTPSKPCGARLAMLLLMRTYRCARGFSPSKPLSYQHTNFMHILFFYLFIHQAFQNMLSPGQSCRNIGHQERIHPGYDASLYVDTTHSHSHTHSQLRTVMCSQTTYHHYVKKWQEIKEPCAVMERTCMHVLVLLHRQFS